jgi:hypothetical protein
MEVSKISYSRPIYTAKTVNSNSKVTTSLNNDSFQLSFKGYDKVLRQATKSFLLKDNQVESTFANLFREVLSSDNINKTQGFYDVEDVYYSHGFRGLLYELWKANPIEKLSKYLKHGTINLATQDDKPIFQLVHFDKFGFSKHSPNDVKLVFTDPKEKYSIQYGLNEKGELDIWQTNDDQTVITRYHISTGNRKCEVFQPKDGNPETTYYNKDGSKAFFKNLFRGGVAIVPK